MRCIVEPSDFCVILLICSKRSATLVALNGADTVDVRKVLSRNNGHRQPVSWAHRPDYEWPPVLPMPGELMGSSRAVAGKNHYSTNPRFTRMVYFL